MECDRQIRMNCAGGLVNRREQNVISSNSSSSGSCVERSGVSLFISPFRMV